MKKFENRKLKTGNVAGFTLVELLVVISIMGVLAAFTIPVLKTLKAAQYKKVARVELEQLAAALDNYKNKYGAYPPSNGYGNALLPQLYYELSGVTHDTSVKTFTTLDGGSTISETDYSTAYKVGGVVNCTKGGGEDGVAAQNFLPGLKPNEYNTYVTNTGTIRTTALITSVGGPDQNYRPLIGVGLNPFRYVYPGTNNPSSYDLWVQLVISGKTNLICNWNRQPIVNSPLP
jgi:prepilin-type N-terminal cleavage/methylation domain-containing protein